MKALFDELNGAVKGELYFDEISKRIFSIDASIFQVLPVGVLVAQDSNDIHCAVRACNRQKIPIIPRGAATGINGGCLGQGMIIDTSKYMKKIIEINYEDAFAVCQPGVIQDQLNNALSAEGFCLGPDTSTGNRATIGGMVGNNAAGAHSMRYGKMVDNTLSCRTILSDDTVHEFGEETEQSFKEKVNSGGRVGEIYKCIDNIITNHRDAIDKAFPKIQRRVSGYNLDELIKGFPLNLAKIIVGSEGTFGITDLIKVKICPKPASTVLSVLHFDSFSEALNKVPLILEHKPFSLELIDKNVIELGRQSTTMKGQLNWLEGEPELILVAEFDASTPGMAIKKLEEFQKSIADQKLCYANVSLLDKASQDKVWKLRKAGLGLLMSKRGDGRAVAFLEDVAVAPEKLGSFLSKFKKYFDDAGKSSGFYGHAGVGCVHVRPMLNLKQESDVDLMVQSMEDITDILKEYGGALSGEHGDGLTRSWLNEKMFGPVVYELFKDLKKAFDPDNLMNPGKIVNAPSPRENLKATQSQDQIKINTMLSFEKEGGWNLAVDMCNGNGQCKTPDTGLMCPSFQAYGDEKHSTRARAQSLHAVLNGGLSHHEFYGKDIHDVLDLCIECKGCKTECPSNVDMAKMKSEFLYQYQERNGYPLRSKLFANIGKLSQIASKAPKFVNFVNSTSPIRWVMGMAGITKKRVLPDFARKTFSYWHKSTKPMKADKKVILLNDTFTEHNFPKLGMFSINILNELGYEVIVPPYTCCGRPMISKGFLKQAKVQATKLIKSLLPYVKDGHKVIGIEPSCILTIADDYPDLVSGEDAKDVAAACMTIDKFLADIVDKGEFNLDFHEGLAGLKVHGHCHQKAVEGTETTLKVLNAMPDVLATEIESGCCGMAGSFGYEKEHYDFSMQIGETRLFPAIRKTHSKEDIISNGMSCRCQISHGADRNPTHMIEFINSRIKNSMGSTII
jgi:FAD/FMN-containing dehydrogenase/Fe-S oxidoreductase